MRLSCEWGLANEQWASWRPLSRCRPQSNLGRARNTDRSHHDLHVPPFLNSLVFQQTHFHFICNYCSSWEFSTLWHGENLVKEGDFSLLPSAPNREQTHQRLNWNPRDSMPDCLLLNCPMCYFTTLFWWAEMYKKIQSQQLPHCCRGGLRLAHRLLHLDRPCRVSQKPPLLSTDEAAPFIWAWSLQILIMRPLGSVHLLQWSELGDLGTVGAVWVASGELSCSCQESWWSGFASL